jgi:hypothetical protein
VCDGKSDNDDGDDDDDVDVNMSGKGVLRSRVHRPVSVYGNADVVSDVRALRVMPSSLHLISDGSVVVGAGDTAGSDCPEDDSEQVMHPELEQRLRLALFPECSASGNQHTSSVVGGDGAS